MGEVVKIQNLSASCTLQVTGLDCPDCASKVEKAVQRIPGVNSATISYPLGKLEVDYDLVRTNAEEFIAKIRDLGYDAREYGVLNHSDAGTVIRLRGLDCADCAAKLEKSISLIPGVERAQVNFGASKMRVIHTGPLEEILSTIETMGYSGKVDDGLSLETASSIWKTNQHAIPSLISFFILVVGSIAGYLGVPDTYTHTFFVVGIVLGGYLPAKNGISMLMSTHELDMNILMAIAVAGATAIGEFEEAATVVFLFSFGNALQGYTMDKTRNSIRALMDLAPSEALVKRNGNSFKMPVGDIMVGDIVIVRPGDKIAMDGQVTEGSSSVNQSSITGESLPAEKTVGDEVYAGTINQQGSLDILVTHLAKDNTLSRIIDMVEEAQGQRAPSQQFVDKFAKYYTPAVIVGAALVVAIPTLLMGQPFHKWFYEAMAMLLVACPCALLISTPVAIVSAIGSAAKSGVLIKGGKYLEEAGSLSVVAFDKTGTLTIGQPQVTDVFPVNGYSEYEILTIAAAIESRSEHPLAEAILKHARQKGVIIPQVADFQAFFGKGAQGIVEGKLFDIGNDRLFSDNMLAGEGVREKIEVLQNQGKTLMILGDQDRILGIIAVADVLRDNSFRALEELKKVGIRKTIMLTGDNQYTAQAIAASTGIDEFRSDLLPEEKVSVMKDLLSQYHKVAMVGDGVNDAPAMALSTVGIAMGAAGTDVALETADIALMGDDLTKLSYAIRLSRKTLGIIRQNIAFALIVKALILLLVIPGSLTLWLAVLGDMGTSLLVTLNGMRLLRFKHQG